MQTVHLNIAWLPRTLRFTWSNVLPLKRSAYLSDSNLGRTAESDASHDPLFILQTRRNIVETWKVRENRQPLFAILPVRHARHSALLRRSASIAGGSAIRSRASKRVTFEIHCYEQAY